MCIGGAFNALEYQCAQRASLSELFLEDALQPVQGTVSERL